MITSITNKDVPTRIRERKAFSTNRHAMEGFNDAAGNYIVNSYWKPVVRILPDGTVDKTTKHVYAGHMQLIEQGLGGES